MSADGDALASARGWEILSRLVQDRARKKGPDGDLDEDDKLEELEEAADGARRLLLDPAFQRMRLQNMQAIAEDFVLWLDLDPAGTHFDAELNGIHRRASAKFWELFQPEELIKRATDARRKRTSNEEEHGHVTKRRRRR